MRAREAFRTVKHELCDQQLVAGRDEARCPALELHDALGVDVAQPPEHPRPVVELRLELGELPVAKEGKRQDRDSSSASNLNHESRQAPVEVDAKRWERGQ